METDNTPQVRCTVAGDALRCEITVDGLGTLLATVDDLMACLGIAAAVLDGGEGAARTPGAGCPDDGQAGG